jgi:hypothetical protein
MLDDKVVMIRWIGNFFHHGLRNEDGIIMKVMMYIVNEYML